MRDLVDKTQASEHIADKGQKEKSSATRTSESFHLSNAAKEQIKLIKENDFTLEGQVFRLKIGGKGCDGFTYDIGFSAPHQDDINLDFNGAFIAIDPFTFYYCKEGTLDYLYNPQNDQDGFVFINKNESSYVGKFFKDDSLVPQKES